VAGGAKEMELLGTAIIMIVFGAVLAVSPWDTPYY
jgi:hypothetical protein